MKYLEKINREERGGKDNQETLDLRESKEVEEPVAKLSEEDKDQIEKITLGIKSVTDEVKRSALNDVVDVLENGHPLNKIFRDKESNIKGYIAFEDFNPNEAYIKYMGTDGEVDANIITEIKNMVERAVANDYTKLHFHGWNKRLNKVLTRFGFKRTRTDSMGDYNVDYFEMDLRAKEVSSKSQEALRDKFKQQIILETSKALKRAEDKVNLIETSYQNIIQKIQNTKLSLDEIQQLVLKLKISRHFQNNETLDENTLIDAIIESPKFLNKPDGSLHRLFEIHQQKTLTKIAENRKKRAEIKDNDTFNPYEALFETSSGDYFIAKLLNMPHLEEESDYMGHCVGTSDSYISKIKKGEIEILSFRNTPKIVNNKLKGDEPILTIEYNLKTKTIDQIKGKEDKLLNGHERYFSDFLESLKKLKETKNDKGENRKFIKVNDLDDVELEKDTILTENGKVNFKEYNPNDNGTVLGARIELGYNSSWEDIEKISQIPIPNIEINLTYIKDEYKKELTSFAGSVLDTSTNYLYYKLNSIGGDLWLNGLTLTEGLKLPDSIGRSLNLSGLTSAEGLKLPDSIGGDLWLYRLTSAEGLKLPDSIGGDLWLNGLTSTEGLKLPDSIGGILRLNGLTSAEGLKLPDSIEGSLDLNGLTSAEGLKLPDSIGGSLDLNGLTSAEGLKLPDSIGEDLWLNGLTSAEGLKLPDSIEGGLWLKKLSEEAKVSLRNEYPHLADKIR